MVDPRAFSARFERPVASRTPRADDSLSPVFFYRGGTTSTSAAVLAASAPAVASRDAPATQDLKVDKVSDEVAVVAGEFASSRARQAPLPDPPKPQRQCVTRPLRFWSDRSQRSRSLAGPDLRTRAFPAETESKMSSGVKSENPISHSAPNASAAPQVRPRRCELKPSRLSHNFQPSRRRARRRADPSPPLSPTPRPSFHLQTDKHEAIPAKGGAQADVSTSRDGAHPITPRGFILLVYFCASVGPRRTTPDAFARTRGGTRHRTTSTRLSWTRTLDSIGLGRVFTSNGDAMVEKEPVGCPDADWRRRGSRVAGSRSARGPHRAHDRWEVANVFSSEVVWRVLEGFSDVFGASRRGKSRGARVLLPGDPLHISSRRASSRPPSTPGFGRTRFPSGGGPMSSPERVRPGPRRVRSRPDIDHDRFAATDARVRARGGRRAPRPGRDTSANFANVSFSDAIFFSIHRPAGDKKPKETKWTAWEEQKFFSALKVRPSPRRTLRIPAGSPSGLRSPTSRSLASVAALRAKTTRPPFFFHASRRPRR